MCRHIDIILELLQAKKEGQLMTAGTLVDVIQEVKLLMDGEKDALADNKNEIQEEITEATDTNDMLSRFMELRKEEKRMSRELNDLRRLLREYKDTMNKLGITVQESEDTPRGVWDNTVIDLLRYTYPEGYVYKRRIVQRYFDVSGSTTSKYIVGKAIGASLARLIEDKIVNAKKFSTGTYSYRISGKHVC